jgi:hypothetical protein
MLTSVGKVPLRLGLWEAQPERRTGSWGQPERKNPRGHAKENRAERALNLFDEPKAKS